MPELRTTLNLAVKGGPVVAFSSVESFEAYDVIDVVVPPATTSLAAVLQPAAADKMNLMLIQSDLYGEEIGYAASDGSTDSDDVALHGPHMFNRGMLALFGTDVLQLKFRNDHPAPATGQAPKTARIQVLVGRGATT